MNVSRKCFKHHLACLRGLTNCIIEESGATAPTLNLILEYAEQIGHPADDAQRFYEDRAGKNWPKAATWQSDFKCWASRFRPPTPAGRPHPDDISAEVLKAKADRRAVYDAVMDAACKAGRQLTKPERYAIVKSDPALKDIGPDEVKGAMG